MSRWLSGGTIRDWLLFLGGMSGTGYETIAEHIDRPWLLGVFVAMMGLPHAFRVGRDDNGPSDGDGGDSSSGTP